MGRRASRLDLGGMAGIQPGGDGVVKKGELAGEKVVGVGNDFEMIFAGE